MTKILVVDDSAFVRSVILRILESNGYETMEAENGGDALKKFSKDRYDLVLLDLRMPGSPSGFDTYKELKKIDSNVKCIVVSIVRKEEVINEALELGIKGYLMKPVTEEKLIPKVKEVLAN